VSVRPASLADAYAACEQLARSHYENFPVASRLLPSAMRPHVVAVYAFARVADDLADEGAARPEERRARLRAWQEGLHRAVRHSTGDLASLAVSNRASADPRRGDRDELILSAVGHSIRSLDLPITLFDDLISAFGQDTMTTRYHSWCDVLDYCRRSANPVGRLVLRIAGYRDASLDRSSDGLCTALQLTNFWQDFGRDWQIGRLYVPAEAIQSCGAREDDLGRDRLSPAWVRTIDACIALTRRQFAEGRAVCDGVSGRLGLELRLTWLGGVRILDRVERGRFDILHRRPTLGLADVPLLAMRAVAWSRESPAHGSTKG
jgi:hydroxysqualene synthase